MSKIFILWNNAKNLVDMVFKTKDEVSVLSADPDKGSALINPEEVELFKQALRAKGYSETEIQKITDAENSDPE